MNEDTQAADGSEVIELEVQPEEDIESVRAELAAEREAKRQILARAHAAEQRLKSAKTVAHDPDRDEITDLRLDGYSKEDARFILANGGRKALEDKDSIVAIALSAKKERAQALSESAKVGSASPTSDVERRFSLEEMEAMPLDELRKILPKSGN